jgi:hypothetical protein
MELGGAGSSWDDEIFNRGTTRTSSQSTSHKQPELSLFGDGGSGSCWRQPNADHEQQAAVVSFLKVI